MTIPNTHGCCSYILRMKQHKRLSIILRKVEEEAGVPVRSIRSDNGTEFRNSVLNNFCTGKGISRQFSAPRTPQQNGVVERKNRTLIEAARTMLNEAKLPTYLWAEAVSTACYTQNRTLINKMYEKTPYELMAHIKPSVKYFHVFGGKCYVLKDSYEHLGKFDAKADEGILLGYSLESKAYRVYVIESQKVMESLDVRFDDTKSSSIQKEDDDESLAFENLYDIEDNDAEPEVAAEDVDNNDNDDNDDPDSCNGNGSTGSQSQTISGSSPQTKESADQNNNDSGGVKEESTSQNQQNVEHAESSRSYLPRQRV